MPDSIRLPLEGSGRQRDMIWRITARSPARPVGMLLAGLILLFACRSAVAEPALWVARGPNATVYLFGTIHILKKYSPWRSPEIMRALAQSEELWLEIPDPGNRDVLTQARQLGLDPRHPLSSKISAPQRAHLDAAAKAAGMQEGEKALEPMRPWLAAVVLADAMIVHAGYDPEGGVDIQLRHQAVAARKAVRGFETASQQLHFLADMAPAVELQLLLSTLQDLDEGPQALDVLVDAWKRGDDAEIARTMIDPMRTLFPALYRVLLLQRNEAWADVIGQMVEGSGIKFVAVGAAHLAGPDSVLTALKRRGIEVERVGTTP
jgi:uncharacterized protein